MSPIAINQTPRKPSSSNGVTRIVLPPLHPLQMTVARCQVRHRICRCGRRWGKTRLAATLALETLLNRQEAVWVAPIWSEAQLGIDLIQQLTAPLEVTYEVSKAQFVGYGGRIRFRSGDKPKRLRGLGADLLVMDEAAYADPELWGTLRPSLADHNGRLFAISTPNGAGWFTDLEQQRDTATFHFGSASNPYLDPAEIVAMRRDLPPKMALQELDAEIVDMAGSVFPPLVYCAPQSQPIEGHQYVAGCDVGGSGEDYSVFTVFDVTLKHIPFYSRFHGQQPEVLAQFAHLSKVWNCAGVVVETNGIGAAIYEGLSREGVPVVGWTTTNSTKVTLVNKWLNDPPPILKDDIVRGEFSAFVAKRIPSGLYKMGASHGHDDCVMSALIANWAGAEASEPYVAKMT